MKKILFMVCILIFGIHYSQTYYSQNFNTPGLNSWVSTDLDGDGNQWANINLSNFPNSGAVLGAGSLLSYSYKSSQGLNPNDLITSPLIDLSTVTASNVFLTYDLIKHPQDDSTDEKYSVYVTTTNASADINAATPIHTDRPQQPGVQARVIDLTSFIGQQVYVSFRHYDSSPSWAIGIDNVQVKSISNPSKEIALKKSGLGRYGLVNTSYSIKAIIKNTGIQAINNITINWNDGTDHISTIQLPSSLISGLETTISLPTQVNYSLPVEKNINISITEVNGSPDTTPADNTLATKFTTVSQNSPKKVVVEEGTGTWCGYCVRGILAMEKAKADFPDNFIGIAVHGGRSSEPMLNSEYLGPMNLSGFPGMNTDRVVMGDGVFPNTMSDRVSERKNIIVPAALNATSTLAGRTLTLNASAIFRANFTNANFRLAVVLVEDEVKGTTPQYDQVNYYSYAVYGTSDGPMGGFENKPSPIPAADMTYDHVGRMLLGGYAGQAGSVPVSIIDGQTVNYTFTADIPTAYNIGHMKAVVLLLDATSGEIVNAAGPFVINGALGTNDVKMTSSDFTIYPNPARDYIKIQAKGKVDLKIFDTSGRIVIERSGVEPNASVSTQSLIKGSYVVSVQEKGSEPKTKNLIIK
ncbi:MAG: choice-of-anchor J domain-containing protein [Chryseobacterium jejuense]|uniref:choice-of-anchor J domain-containing protein n=1 Tax=Chryseobacterium jejuense TaxID=445960 RepID=UPI003D131C41